MTSLPRWRFFPGSKIALAGRSYASGSADFVLARYNADAARGYGDPVMAHGSLVGTSVPLRPDTYADTSTLTHTRLTNQPG